MAKTYRCYENERNAVGGLDGLGTGWGWVDAATAQKAADEYAASVRGIKDCRGNVVVATDDDGDSAEAIV